MQTPSQWRLVILESPYGGDPKAIERNITYARAAAADCIARGESPYASHLLLTQPGILDDGDRAERERGIAAGLAWYAAAEAAVFYLDKGFSTSMRDAFAFLQRHRPTIAIEWRFLDPVKTIPAGIVPYFRWEAGFCSTLSAHAVAEMPLGRLEAARNSRAPTIRAAYEVRLGGRPVAFYGDMDTAMAGAEQYYCWHLAQRTQ